MSKQVKAWAVYNGKAAEAESFAQAAMRVQDNLPSGGTGWAVEQRPRKRPGVWRIESGKRRASAVAPDTGEYLAAVERCGIEHTQEPTP